MNTNKTYIAFDALAVSDQENSNIKTFHLLQDWERQHPDRYHFVNMEDIDFSATHQDLIDSILKPYFLRKMTEADNLLVLCSKVMNTESPILNWQISKAVNRFHLPVIVAYVGLEKVSESTLRDYNPFMANKIRKYLSRDSAPMAHVPLTKDKLERALSAFSVKDNLYPWHSDTIY